MRYHSTCSNSASRTYACACAGAASPPVVDITRLATATGSIFRSTADLYSNGFLESGAYLLIAPARQKEVHHQALGAPERAHALQNSKERYTYTKNKAQPDILYSLISALSEEDCSSEELLNCKKNNRLLKKNLIALSS
jgi:hypothetical protein